MKIVFLSGKGGTGKTTLASAFAKYFKCHVVDCDVDAPNFHLTTKIDSVHQKDFKSGYTAYIDKSLCVQCGACQQVCHFDAIHEFIVDATSCEGCKSCGLVCQSQAISYSEDTTATIYMDQLVYEKAYMSHAKMQCGADGSGKLITTLRRDMECKVTNDELVVLDGSPGIGCAVMASLTGCDLGIIVTEPSLSGKEDLKRILDLCNHFHLPVKVCINKWDLNEEITCDIIRLCEKLGIKVLGQIAFDQYVSKAINEEKNILDCTKSQAGQEILGLISEFEKEDIL
ncbi:ATP-binding protein [Vallitalea okinawensis]|uniref:ATP-binding protein n=1 Tax=Vallitalea okinawensis TaxID=2078660 RepID=UPI000CFCF021|nr:ATP-binding protein [Vallitalea okinawensis]